MESGPRVGCMGMDRCITKMVLWSGRFVCVFSVKCGVYVCGCACAWVYVLAMSVLYLCSHMSVSELYACSHADAFACMYSLSETGPYPSIPFGLGGGGTGVLRRRASCSPFLGLVA